ncbi:MAG TPA: CcmD family protein [Polyangiaceae bacterium]|jgi:CcmD family protein|nr:CcmD family protein [Polyangiaceae bacterium]
MMTDIAPMPSAAPSSTPDDRATSFVAVEGNAKEQYSGGTLLVVAYSALWVVLFAWVAVVWRKQSALNRRLADLERVLDKAAADAEAEKK